MYPRGLTWIELRRYIEERRGPIVIPIGSVEAHGAHLPIDTDTIIASIVADTLAERSGWVSLPPVTYSIAVPTRPSNVRIPPAVFSAYLRAILEHFASFGQRSFVVVLGHGGPEMKSAIVDACRGLCEERGVSIAVFHVSQALRDLGLVDTSIDRHAGWWETSIVMAVDPKLVKDLSIYREPEDLRRYGVAGNPLNASAEQGRRLLNAVVSHIEEVVRSGIEGCFFNWRQG